MTKRKWILSIALASLLLLAGGIGWRMLAKSHITKANFERIEVGMTEAEVEKLLGGPADRYAPACWLGPPPPFDEGVAGYWYGEESTFVVDFQVGKVVQTSFYERGRSSHDNEYESWWSKKYRFLRYLGL